MRTPQRGLPLRGIIAAAVLAITVGAVGTATLMSEAVYRSSSDALARSLGQVVEVGVGEGVEGMREHARHFAESIASIEPLRRAMREEDGYRAALDEVLALGDVTQGVVRPHGVVLFDAGLRRVASTPGLSASLGQLPEALRVQLASRSGAERLKPASALWPSPEGPVYSLAVPLGGLRFSGYAHVMLRPEHHLAALREILHAPIAIRSLGGETLFASEGWMGHGEQGMHETDSDAQHALISHTLTDAAGEPVLTVQAMEDMTSLVADVRRTQAIGLAILFASAGLGGALLLLGARRYVLRPIDALNAALAHCAAGRFDDQLPAQPVREMQQLSTRTNSLIASLAGQVKTLRSGITRVDEACATLCAVSEQTRTNLSRQHEETESAASAVTEMTATAEEVARNMAHADSLAQSSAQCSERSASQVAEVLGAIETLSGHMERSMGMMSELERRAREIGQVLDVINGISEKTNLLALNAAIEAARAGEHGRGFSVVADEVRTLSARTQESTQSISEIIRELQTQATETIAAVDSGRSAAAEAVGCARSAGEGVEDTRAQSAQAREISTTVAAAAEEQSQVAGEISRSLEQLRAAARDSHAFAGQLQGSVTELRALSGDLGAALTAFGAERSPDQH